MGAIVDDRGATFRVWAPFASSVCVAGTFNGWSATAAPLDRDGSGYWSGDVDGARAGDRYKFVVTGASNPWKVDPYAVRLDADGNAVLDDGTYQWAVSSYRTPPWNELVIYEVHVGTFNDPRGDGSGTLATALERLDYLADLGVNAIELMPPAQFSGERSWGYNPAYPFAIDQTYGSPDDLKRFVDEAHRRGMIVIVDVVYNHFGETDLWQFDGWNQDGHGGIYFYNDWRRVTPWGETRPDYGRPEVRQYLRDNALMWLEEYRCDGLRFDATPWIRNVYGNDGDLGSDL
ncbi:MAG: 1,4-alpha-glucan branching protein, partial [Candidatus Eremiobacteraeota bacterium]|nr:1,4-alpha-glucan branching protein [Candidatus Eremiobacteraeota bacterium]